MSERIATELSKIAQKNDGILKPETVIEEAKPKNHPLHNDFEWDDTKAGYKYRLEQARYMIRMCVTVVESNNQLKEYPTFVSLSVDRKKDGGGYRALVDVMSHEEHRWVLLRDALNDMTIFTSKYWHLQELSSVIEVIKKTSQKLVKKLK